MVAIQFDSQIQCHLTWHVESGVLLSHPGLGSRFETLDYVEGAAIIARILVLTGPILILGVF